jgi:leucyl aminopeptidase
VRIPGKSFPNEVIILGSHLDSINPGERSNYAPGADDNASGTATNMEIFRVLMANNIYPDRTIEIHAYAAEEIGLVGSMEIANTYRKNNVAVHAMIQFDMNGYANSGFDRVWLVANKTDRALTNQLGELTETYLKMPWSTGNLWAGSSDHASWDKYGYPVAFPFEHPTAHNPHIHTSRDTVQNINAWPMVRAYAQLGLAYLLKYGVVH